VSYIKKWLEARCSENNFLGGIYFIQKCQISKFVFDHLQSSSFGGTLAPLGDLGSKNLPGQKFLEFNIRWVGGSILCHKYKIKNFQRPPILGDPWAPGVVSDEKVSLNKIFLEFDCRGVYLSENSIFCRYPPIQDPSFFALNPKHSKFGSLDF
jgi:hypothetical protein